MVEVAQMITQKVAQMITHSVGSHAALLLHNSLAGSSGSRWTIRGGGFVPLQHH